MEELTRKLLEKRGITQEEDILEFFSNKPKLTFDPLLMPDISEGVNLLLSEIEAKSKVMIYGDYDADGITATTLMYTILSRIMDTNDLSFYIPNRTEEGYGLNRDAIKNIYDEGFRLIITVDCGSVSYDEIEYAKELGIKVIVTDHHNITDKMADTIVINPKRPDSIYPFKELSGCGVAFKFAQLLRVKTGLDKSVLNEVLDLVAIGTIGDIMPLVSENRTLVKYGLNVINSGNRVGLKLLIERIGLKLPEITSGNVGFAIVPHLNASGRMADAKEAVQLLLLRNIDELNKITSSLVEKNQERKKYQQEAYDKSVQLLKDNTSRFIFLRLDDQHEGILGIVAGKIKDDFYRPTVILSKIKDEEDVLKGTGRSIEGFDIYLELNKYKDLFIKFGGHSGACGFSISKDNFEILKEKILADTEDLNEDLFIRKDEFDFDIFEDEINIKLAEDLKLFEPFGKDNKKPKFRVQLNSLGSIRYLGTENKHFRFDRNNIQYVLFNKGREYNLSDLEGSNVNAYGTIDIKSFRGEKNLQFVLDKIVII